MRRRGKLRATLAILLIDCVVAFAAFGGSAFSRIVGAVVIGWSVVIWVALVLRGHSLRGSR